MSTLEEVSSWETLNLGLLYHCFKDDGWNTMLKTCMIWKKDKPLVSNKVVVIRKIRCCCFLKFLFEIWLQNSLKSLPKTYHFVWDNSILATMFWCNIAQYHWNLLVRGYGKCVSLVLMLPSAIRMNGKCISYCNRLLQTLWLKTLIFYFTVLEIRNLK